MPKRFATIDLSTGLPETALVPRTVDVVDAAARLALTTATVRAGDFAREVGRAEVTKLTCLGTTYTAAVAETTEITCNPDVAGSLNNTWFYLSTLTEGVYVWFNVDATGSDPLGYDRGIEIAIPTNETAVNIAIAITAALDADADFSATRVGAVVTVVNDDAGLTITPGSGDNDSGFSVTNPQPGANATHDLQGDTLTLLNGAGASVTVGFSLAGNVGTIPVLLPASTQTAAQIAALMGPLIHAHADFTATVGTGGATAEVTVTNVANGLVSNGTLTAASAGSTGFTVAVLTAGKTGALTFVLVDETQIASEAGWKELLTLVSFSGSNASGVNQTLSSATHTKLNLTAQDWDTHNQFDPTLARFICKIPGKYQFSLSIDMANANASSTRKIVQLYKNGTLSKRLVDIPITTGVGNDHIIGADLFFDLVAGDYIEPYGYANNGGATIYFDSAVRSFFQALRVGP